MFWTFTDMNVARVAHQCGVLADGRLVVASGDGLGDQKLSTEILDPVRNPNIVCHEARIQNLLA